MSRYTCVYMLTKDMEVQLIHTSIIKEEVYYDEMISTMSFVAVIIETLNIFSCVFAHFSCCFVLGTCRISHPALRWHRIFVFVLQDGILLSVDRLW